MKTKKTTKRKPKYILTDCEEMNRSHPTTFYVPSDLEKQDLLNKSVKLIFSDPVTGHCERLWIKVLDKEQHMYGGVLDNCPIFLNMKVGQIVLFETKHVADIIN